MFNVGSVQGYLKLNTLGWNASMRSAAASVTALSRTFTRMAAVTVGSLVLIEREFGRFDKAIRHATSVSETTAAQFEKMSDMALDASVKWNKAASATAQAFYFLGSAGLSVTEQLQAFNTTIMLSRAMGSELAHTVEGTVDVVRAFGLEFENIDRIADQLTKTVISSNQTFAILTRALSYASSTARLTNNTLAETTAMLGVMANAGIKGSMAGTVLRRAMTNLMAPTGDMAELVYALGLNIYDTTGKMRPFIDIMGQISDALVGTSARYKNLVFETLFGRRAIAGQIVLFNYGSEALQRYANEIENAAGTTERVAGKQMKAFTEVLGQLWQEIRRVAITTGETLAPAIERVANSIRYNLKEFREYIKANEAAVTVALKWTTVISAALLVGMPLLFVITSLTSKMVALAVVIANPFMVLIAALYTLRAVWKQTSDEMKASIRAKAYQNIGGTGIALGTAGAGALAGSLFGPIGAGVGGAAGLGLGIFEARKAKKAYQNFVELGKRPALDFQTLWSETFEAVKTQMSEDFGAVSGTLENMDGIAGKVMDNLKKYVEGLTKAINILMRPTNVFFNQFGRDLEKLEKKWAKMRKDWADSLIGGKGLAEASSIWEKRWTSGIGIVINSLETWHNVFAKANRDIKSGWADTIGSFLDDTMGMARTFENVMESMFKNVLNAFNRLVAEMLARQLWYSIFGKGIAMPFGTAVPFGQIEGAKTGGGAFTPGIKMPPLEGMGKAAPGVVVNLNNNTGTQMDLSASKPVFNGEDYVIDVVLKRYGTDPNFRKAIGG